MTINDQKQKFLENEVLTNSLFGGLTRGFPVYRNGASQDDKGNFKKFLREKLKEYTKQYISRINSIQHIKNIRDFTNETTASFSDILNGDCFRIGRAQKVFNLYLKYLWTLDKIAEPPHCPFDSIIIKELGLSGTSWTRLNKVDDYEKLVQRATQVANKDNLSIAQWELKYWNESIANLEPCPQKKYWN